MTFDTIKNDFALLDDWEDRYRYVIELGKALPAMPPEFKTDATKVRGCASQVWIATRTMPQADGTSRLNFEGDSDALIVRGLIAILLALYNGKTPHDILATDAPAALARLGLQDHLTPQRSNGVASMIARIRRDATMLSQAA